MHGLVSLHRISQLFCYQEHPGAKQARRYFAPHVHRCSFVVTIAPPLQLPFVCKHGAPVHLSLPPYALSPFIGPATSPTYFFSTERSYIRCTSCSSI